MERRKHNWGTLSITTRRNPLFRSSPNLNLNSKSDEENAYGLISKHSKSVLPPPVPTIPLEFRFREEYQKLMKENQNKMYWESIKQKLTDYYCHHQQSQPRKNEFLKNRSMETKVGAKTNSTNKIQKDKQNSVTQAVPVQSSLGLEDDWIPNRNRRDSESTNSLLNQECEIPNSCENIDFLCGDDDSHSSEKSEPLCVKCLVSYYNTGPVMSRVSFQ